MKRLPAALPLAGLALIIAACAPAGNKAETPAPAPVHALETEAKAMMAQLVLTPDSADAFTVRCDTSLELVNKMIADMEARDAVAGAADIKFLDTI
ncbi:MAG: hypothetical protein ABIH17_06295, partial [Pseudomonadota bacterium]